MFFRIYILWFIYIRMYFRSSSRLMIELDSHEGSFLSICRHYLAIYNTSDKPADDTVPDEKETTKKKSSTFASDKNKKPETKAEVKPPVFTAEETAQKLTVLKHVLLYLILAPYDNEQSDLLHRVKLDPMLAQIPLYKYV